MLKNPLKLPHLRAFSVLAPFVVAWTVCPVTLAAQNPSTTELECRVQYRAAQDAGVKPTRDVALRSLTITQQGGKVVAVQVDGQSVYRFSTQDNVLFTSMDSERIQIIFSQPKAVARGNQTSAEAAQPTIRWSSNHRDRDFADGVCLARQSRAR